MAAIEVWSSDESEPEEQVSQDEEMDVDSEEEEYNGNEIHEDANFYPSIKNFEGTAEINTNIFIAGNSPIDYFKYFCDSFLSDIIVKETNRYESQNHEEPSAHMIAWRPLTVDEFENFLGLSILMGHIQKGELKSYWSTDQLLNTPIFGQIMSRDRYVQILRYLHFQDNENESDVSDHALRKIKPAIDHLQGKFAAALIPGQNLCIDESLLLWKGRLKFKQYIPLKRNRFGIKLFEIVDCETGYILGFVIYTGADTEIQKFGLGITGDIVAHFLQPYLHKGHIMYVDNWYTSPTLAEFLHDRDTGLCGTVKANRKGMPKLDNKLVRGEVQIAHNDVWMVIKWEDKRSVRMLTSVHELEFCGTRKIDHKSHREIVKPTCVVDYNKNMGGVDNVDRQLSITRTVRKTMKWYRKLFFHLIDLSLSNAHAMYKMKNEGPAPFPSFRLEVARRLLGLDIDERIPHNVCPPNRLVGRHFPGESNSRRCHLCYMRKVTRRTKYICKTCDIPLCVVSCFEQYHTQATLP